jgi:hypothetical protein
VRCQTVIGRIGRTWSEEAAANESSLLVLSHDGLLARVLSSASVLNLNCIVCDWLAGTLAWFYPRVLLGASGAVAAVAWFRRRSPQQLLPRPALTASPLTTPEGAPSKPCSSGRAPLDQYLGSCATMTSTFVPAASMATVSAHH